MSKANEKSYRDAGASECYDVPRVISNHNRVTYDRIEQLANNLNFNSPIFNGMMKRTRSLGSAQAFICELALADKRFIEENLLPFCIGDGVNVLLDTHYLDTLYFDRLAAYSAKRQLPSRKKFDPNEQSRAYFK